ncbi:MAG: luh [Gammaproteobacteria bacterium]|nr:luh [Gammaproteobacteria bacterium]
MLKTGRVIAAFLLSFCAVVTGRAATASEAAAGSEWRLLGGNADAWHYSALDQISDHNVQRLGLAWMADIPSKDGLTGNPLVAEAVVYQSGPLGRIYANDVRTGKLLWRFGPQVNFDEKTSLAAFFRSRYNRGLALLGDNVDVASGDCRLFAVDRKTGKEVWEAVSCDRSKQYGITQAPRVGDGKVFIGNNCIDGGYERGYVDAFDAKTGKRMWRFYTMPGDPSKPFESKAMEMAAKTWGTGYWDKTHGSVSAWDAMTYDEKLNLLYIGTGSGSPWSPKERAPDAGDELFSNSIVAVNASTGDYVWHYQTVQHDGWDFDATMHIMLAELPVKGSTRRVVMTAPKNGFFYVLDAKTGQFLSANNYLPVNWASHIDPKTGRAVTLPDARYWEHPGEATIVSPGPLGAHNWQAMAYNPATRLVYIPAYVIPTSMKPDPKALVGGMEFDMYYGSAGDPKWTSRGELIAWDPITQTARWRVKRSIPLNGGVLSTAGNLVFQGTAEGTFDAFAADTGKPLWSFNAHGAIQAAPTTVQIDGEQLVLVAAGNAGSATIGTYLARYTSTPESRSPSRLLAFKLGGTGTVPSTVVQDIPQPPLPRPSAALAKQGGVYFENEFCVDCHGIGAENARSSILDLRLASAQTHQQLPAIVLGGLRRDKGMPAFPNLPVEELKAIQAFILSEAWAAYDQQQARAARQPAGTAK